MSLVMEASRSRMTNTCPMCRRIRVYKSRAGFLRANKKNLPCMSCSNSIKGGGEGKVIDELGRRKCFDCKEFKDIAEFYKEKGGVCKICSHIRGQQYNKSIYRYSRHGITKADFDKMMEDQNNKCAICGDILTEGKHIQIDHCHSSGHIRGILCGLCNKGLGQFRDNKASLLNAIKYLEIHE